MKYLENTKVKKQIISQTKNNSKKTAVILLSGGLDSVVSIAESECDIKMGLIIDYGQISYSKEKAAAQKIADFYKFPLISLKLDWLKEITKNGLTDINKAYKIKNFKDKKELETSMKSVWVPNRNALFINIAASFCEAKDIDYIIIGANKEEGQTFKDNSKEFIEECNKLLKTSTNKKIKVLAPLINLNKNEIIKTGIKLNVPFEYIYSCYKGKKKHCGECESCLRLKKALENNNREDLIKKLF